MTWAASSGATSYDIYRGTTAANEVLVDPGINGTSFTDTGLTNGTTYYYQVTAVNAGGQSGYSNQVSALPQVPVPATPTGLVATAGNAQVALSWSASTNATGYDIYEGTGSGGETLLTSVTGTSYTNTGLTNGTKYYYEVSAVDAGGQSGKSSEVSATPQVAAPAAPTNLVATAGNAQVALSWTASSGAASYDLYRGTSSGGETLVDSGITGTSFTDTGLTDGTTYYYEVSAVNAGGQSGKSNQVSATPANQSPAITTPASASPATVTGKTTNLSVQASDPDGDALTYTWAVTGGPSGVSFNANGTSSANNATATFIQAGSYTFQVTVRDTAGLTATSSVTVTVNQTLTSLAVVPSTTSLHDGGTQQFTVSAKDQFGNAMTITPTWSVTSGPGSISTTGLYTAPVNGSFSATVQAASGSLTASAAVTITNQAPTVVSAATPHPIQLPAPPPV